jgi:hypothetical protein
MKWVESIGGICERLTRRSDGADMSDNKECWRAESLRATSFHAKPINFREADYLKDALGVDVDLSQITQAGRQDSVSYEKGQLICSVSTNRVDWVYTSAIPMVGEDGGLGEVGGAISLFRAIIDKWFIESPPVMRMAFGGVAYKPVADKEAGYRCLQEYLRELELDPVNSSDLNYRINRPRCVEIGDEEIILNRISTWSVRRIEMSLSGPSEILLESTAFERATCDIDINTDVRRKRPIGEGIRTQLVGRMEAMFREILDNGNRA